jgi:L-fucose mutarotase
MPLKGIPRLISPEMLRILAQMGHGDELLISDANFPSHNQQVNFIVHADGSSATEVLKAILQLFPLDSFASFQATVMKQVHSSTDAPIIADFQRLLNEAYHADGSAEPAKIERIDRFAFYDKAKSAFAICVTGKLAENFLYAVKPKSTYSLFTN